MNFIGHHLLVIFFVPPGVLGLAAEHAKVFGSVVSFVAVDVVDDFTGEQRAAQDLLGHDPVRVPAVGFPVAVGLAV